jgi:hypothetical protein
VDAKILAVPDTDWGLGDDTEELYHSVRFRVSSNGVTSPWTAWHNSLRQDMQR